MRPVAKWGDIGFANVAFGQGLTVTPLQMADRRVARLPAAASTGSHASSRAIVQADGTIETLPARAGAAA